MKDLIHYIIIRKDLPLGVIAAMVTHAAGESGALYRDPYDGRFRGAIAVVLEATNEAHLHRIGSYLFDNHVRRVYVHEHGGIYDGQLMAIGVVPGDRSELSPYFTKFQTLKTCVDNPPTIRVSSLNPNENLQSSQEAAPLVSER